MCRGKPRALPALALTAAGALAASSAPAAPAWEEARLSAGYRVTAGSRDYVGHALPVRAAVPLAPAWTGYARLDLATDRAYERAVSGVLGLERELPRGWAGWAGAGGSGATFKDGASASSFLFETGAGRELGRWWADAEYRLTRGEVGRVLPGQAVEAPAASGGRSGTGPHAHDGGHGGDGGSSGQPVLSAPSETGERFDQHELALFVGSPVFRLGRPVSFGLSPSVWRRSGGLEGASGHAGLTVRLTPRWSLVLGTSADFPNRGRDAYYGSAGVRYAVLPR